CSLSLLHLQQSLSLPVSTGCLVHGGCSSGGRFLLHGRSLDCCSSSSVGARAVLRIRSRISLVSRHSFGSLRSILSRLSNGSTLARNALVASGSVISLISLISDLSGQSSGSLGAGDSDLV
ncbi:hypothetical protein PMAYCL1PPCAC_13287, partial [Pristionchus mayeri]